MNKKLFTLMTLGLLTAGSAFNGVNAQSNAAADKTALDGTKWYFLGTAGDAENRYYVGGREIEIASQNNKKVTIPGYSKQKLSVIKNLTSSGEGAECLDAYLWSIEGTKTNGAYTYTFTNKKTQKVMTFKSDGGLPQAGDGADAVYNFDGLTLATVNTDGTYKQATKIRTKDDAGQFLTVTDETGASLSTGSELVLYTIDDQSAEAEKMGVFALSFPSVDPQPETNVFDQKMKAFKFDNNSVAPKAGTYLATSWPADGTIDNPGEFYASTFIAVSPTKNFGINGLK